MDERNPKRVSSYIAGKVPFLKVNSFLVSEFDPTVAFIRAKGHSLSDHLNKLEQAEMRAYMALVDSVLINAEVSTGTVFVTQTASGDKHNNLHNLIIDLIINFVK